MQEVDKLRKLLTAVKNYVDNNIPIRISDLENDSNFANKEDLKTLDALTLNGYKIWVGTTSELNQITERDPNTLYFELDDGTGGEEVVENPIVNGVLTLTTDKYQKTEMVDGTTIKFPKVTSFTEIHLYFNAKTNLSLKFPFCKWRVDPNIEAGNSYEIVFTYNTKDWLVNVIVYTFDAYDYTCTDEYILDKMYPMPQAHEAIPSGVTDTWKTQSRWENQERPTAAEHNCGQSGCPGAVQFQALGAWANIYRVDGTTFTQNTGVEMKNIKVYGWYNGQWEEVQNMPIPSGNFYAESFSGDANSAFPDSVKQTSTSKTIILREANKINGENCMYHPFSEIKNFDTKYEYVYTCIDLRKVMYDENGVDDRDTTHYCANCGGDWWLAEGLAFDSSWQHNHGIAQPKIVEVTNDWQRFSMTTVPENWENGFPE